MFGGSLGRPASPPLRGRLRLGFLRPLVGTARDAPGSISAPQASAPPRLLRRLCPWRGCTDPPRGGAIACPSLAAWVPFGTGVRPVHPSHHSHRNLLPGCVAGGKLPAAASPPIRSGQGRGIAALFPPLLVGGGRLARRGSSLGLCPASPPARRSDLARRIMRLGRSRPAFGRAHRQAGAPCGAVL